MFLRKCFTAVAAMVVLSSASAVAAERDPFFPPAWQEADKDDAECIYTILALVGQLPEEETKERNKRRTSMLISLGYFSGRLAGRSPELELPSLVTKEFGVYLESNQKKLSTRCQKLKSGLEDSLESMSAVAHKFDE